MIRHQSAMNMSIYFEIGSSFLLRKSESKIKSVVQVAYKQIHVYYVMHVTLSIGFQLN